MGAATVPEILSDLTWALGNNLFGWLGMEGTVNFWYEVFTGSLRFKPLSARSGSFGVDLGGLMAKMVPNPVWTFQHTVYAKPNTFESLQPARVFVPSASFAPTLYGSVLRIKPASGPAYLLDGPRDPAGAAGSRTGPLGWTRAGGTAVPVLPGSPVPVFPTGGLHADAAIATVTSPQSATATELLPTGRLLLGEVTSGQVAVLLTDPVSGLAVGDTLLLTGGATPVIADIAVLPDTAGTTRAVLNGADSLAAAASGTRVRARRLAASRTETDSAVAGHTDLLDAHAASGGYPPGAALRLRQSGSVVGAVTATGLSASLTLAGPAPAALGGPITVYAADEGGSPVSVTVAAPSTLTYPAGATTPTVGEFLAVRGTSGDPIVAAVTAVGATVTVDADLTALGSPVSVRPIVAGVRLGLAGAGPDASLALAYVPDAPAQAASARYVRMEPATGPVTVRRVAGVGFDALAVTPALPGNTGAPYDVEVFSFSGFDASDLAIEAVSGVTLAPLDALNGATALALVSVAGRPPTPAGSLFTGGASTGTVMTFPPATGRPAGIMLPLVVLVGPAGAATTPALITGVRLTVALDRTLTLAASGLSAAPLAPIGLTYDADRIDATTVTVLPTVGRTAAAAGSPTQMPQFRPGELVSLGWPGGPATTATYRIANADGTTLSLAGGDPVPAGVALTARRLVPTDPGTGAAWAGIRGGAAGTDAAGHTLVAFDVWRPTDLPDSTAGSPTWIGIFDGTTCHPAAVVSTTSVAVTLNGPPPAGSTDIVSPTFRQVTAQNAPVAWQADITSTSTGVVASNFTPPAGSDTVIAVPFQDSPLTVAGSLSSGTVLSPSEPENLELDRFDALAEHELWHTVQSSMWGNALAGFLPIGLLESLAALNPNVELPRYSAYLSGTLNGVNLTISNLSGVTIERGDTLQISASNGTPVEVTVTATGANAGEFTIRRDLAVANGPVSVRRKTPAAWVGSLDGALRILTYGGLLNLTTVNLYEGLGYLIAHGVYWIQRKAGHQDSGYPATVADNGATLTLTSDEGKVALRTAQRVLIRSGDTTQSRTVASFDDNGIHLQNPVQLTGTVTVFSYTMRNPGSTWDWHDYFPASVADASRPAAITVAPVGDRTLHLAVRDEIVVTYDAVPGGSSGTSATGPQPVSGSRRTSVVAADAGGVIEVADPPPTGAQGLRVAKIDTGDPMGNWDSALSTEMGLGHITRWVTDPYGQLQVQLSGRRGSPADIIGRVARSLFGTRAFMIPFGFWFLDNAVKQLNGTPYNSSMEQGASERSGDTYNAIGRLLPDGNGPSVVGDIYRYWLTDSGGNRATGSFVQQTRGDAPGVWLGSSTSPQLMPDVTAETATTPAPNLGATAGASSGDAVPHTMFVAPSAVPGGPPGGSGFPPLARAWIPSSGALERTSGMYVAFRRPPPTGGKHRVSATDNDFYWRTGRLAQNGGSSTVVYDVAPSAVTVTAGGRTVPDAGSLSMIPGQRASVSVTPNGARTYALLLQRPGSGTVLRADGDLTLVAQSSAGTEVVEVVRRYRKDASGNLTDPSLALHGLHLPDDLDIPVSQFTVTVATTLSALATADPAGTVVTEMHPGDTAFLLIPAPVAIPTAITSTTVVGSPTPPLAPGAPPPTIDLAAPTMPANLSAYLGPGVLVQLTAPADRPPEEQTDLTLTTRVGTIAAPISVTTAMRLTPWFRILAPGGATDWHLAPGSTVSLGLSDAAVPQSAQLDPAADVTITVEASDVKLDIAGGAAHGNRTLTVTDANGHTARRTVIIG